MLRLLRVPCRADIAGLTGKAGRVALTGLCHAGGLPVDMGLEIGDDLVPCFHVHAEGFDRNASALQFDVHFDVGVFFVIKVDLAVTLACVPFVDHL